MEGGRVGGRAPPRGGMLSERPCARLRAHPFSPHLLSFSSLPAGLSSVPFNFSASFSLTHISIFLLQQSICTLCLC